MTVAVLPEYLKQLPAWLCWRLMQNPGEKKPRKVPFYVNGAPRNGTPGDSTDRAQLVTFDRALRAAQAGNYSGVGLAILPDFGIVALDFDDVVQDGNIDPRVAALVAGTYSEFSPSGNGVRAFFRGSLPSKKDTDPKKSKARGDDFFKVEVFGTSGFVTVTGNVTPDCRLFGTETTLADLAPAVHDLYKQRWGTPGAAPGTAVVVNPNDALWLVDTTQRMGLSIDEIRELLTDVDPDMGREDWVKVGMALHHETQGSPEGLQLFIEFSRRGVKFESEKDCADRWRSYKTGGNGSQVTMAWLRSVARNTRTRAKYEAAEGWKKTIAEATDEFSLREKLCPEIAKDTRLGELEREALAQVLVDRFKSFGTKYPIAACRKLVAERRAPKQRAQSDDDLPEWARGYVWVTDEDKFYRIDSEEWLTSQSFNVKFNRHMPTNEEGNIVTSATNYATVDLQIKTVTRGLYLPWAEAIFNIDGVDCVNTYRPSSVPAAEPITDQGRAAINRVLNHLMVLCGDRPHIMQTLLSWIAYNVQNPGRKIRWAPLIKGIQGDGKSSIASLLAAVMGRANVRNISPKVIATDFTGWAHGAAIGAIEELRVVGQNRYEILETLKPYVSNDSVEVHPKGKPSFDAINTQNYVAFTNYADSLPINDTDRRWFVVFTPFDDVESLAARVGCGGGGDGLGAYFEALHGAIESFRGQLRQFFLTMPIDPSFKPNGRAPETEERARMIAMSASPEEDAMREVIEAGGEGIGKYVLSSAYVTRALAASDNPDVVVATTTVNRVLTRLGWTKVPKFLKWNGASHRIWVKGNVDVEPANLRKLLDETMNGDDKSHEFKELFGLVT